MLEGMFAIILFDQARNKIHLARDRFGEKPLFISMTMRGLVTLNLSLLSTS